MPLTPTHQRPPEGTPDGAARYETLQWTMFQTANISPICGQLGFFHKFAGRQCEDKRPRDRCVTESRRLLEARLTTRTWIDGDIGPA